jgi:hypothetical protein
MTPNSISIQWPVNKDVGRTRKKMQVFFVALLSQSIDKSMGPLLRSAGFDAEYLPHVHDPSRPFHGIRNDAFTFQQVSDLVESEGHAWCALYRDNWQCVGELYREVLRNTTPYNASLTFAAFPPNTTIYAEGNSFFGQIITEIMCNTKKAVFWSVDGNHTNSMVAHIPTKNITVVLLDNDDSWTMHPSKVSHAFEMLRRQLDFIVVGSINFDSRSIVSRTDDYKSRFPTARVVNWAGSKRLPRNCQANFKNCARGGSHQCLPGPAARSSEKLVRLLLASTIVN